MGMYSKSRVELIALQVLQALIRRRLLRLKWTGMAVTKSKIGEDGLSRLNILNFMARPERRMTSMVFLQGGGQKTISSPLPGKMVREFSLTPGVGTSLNSPAALERELREQERRLDMSEMQREVRGAPGILGKDVS